jgi:hypothetical protein
MMLEIDINSRRARIESVMNAYRLDFVRSILGRGLCGFRGLICEISLALGVVMC